MADQIFLIVLILITFGTFAFDLWNEKRNESNRRN